MATAEEYANWIVKNSDKKGTPEFETVAKAYQAARGASSPDRGVLRNIGVGALKGAANIGATLMSPLDKLSDIAENAIRERYPIAGEKQTPLNSNAERRAKLEDFVRENANPESKSFKTGEIGSEIAGTAGMGGVLGKAVSAAGKALPALSGYAPKLAAALESGGFRTGAEPATTVAGKAANAATRVGAGAATGAASAGLVNPDDAGAGALVGGLLPVGAKAAGEIGKRVAGTLKGILEPLYEGGREKILGRAIIEAAGGNPQQLAQTLRNAQVLVPGSVPTAAEAANSGGISALQRSASAANPESYAFRAQQQNLARTEALKDLAGTSGARDFFAANRDATAKQLYENAYQKGIDITRNPDTGKFLPKAEIAGRKGEITKLMQRPAIQQAVKQARELALNEGVKIDAAGSIKGLDYVKRALDDMIEKSSGNEQRILRNLKERLVTSLDKMSPDYQAARKVFQEMSRPINQMDIAQHIADKSINPLTGALQPNAYARNLSDETAQRATGFGKATLQNILEPDQLSKLKAIKEDLARSVAAQNMGRGAGSDTFQKLSMANLAQRAGIPLGALNLPLVGRFGKFAYSAADEKLQQKLAQSLLTSSETARLIEAASRNTPQGKRLSKLLQSPVFRTAIIQSGTH